MDGWRAFFVGAALAPILCSAACTVAFPLDKYRADPIDDGGDLDARVDAIDESGTDVVVTDTIGTDSAASPDTGNILDTTVPDTADPCGSYRGAKMVLIDGYCIDATEVTNAQYNAFLAASVPTQSSTGSPALCKWNSTWGTPSSPPVDDLPVVNVDWCDAYGYCAWAGKRLCGNAASHDTTLDPGAAATAASEWYYACTNGKSPTAYPYGDTFDPAACNGDGSSGTTAPVAVASFPKCHGVAPPFSDVFDMSGNVDEWEDSCYDSTGAGDGCLVRGGSFSSNPAGDLRCEHSLGEPRNNTDYRLGFRCCK